MKCHERYADGREKLGGYDGGWKANPDAIQNKGARWPANFIHDGSDEVLELFPETKSGLLAKHHKVKGSGGASDFLGASMKRDSFEKDYGGDSGTAARFYYCAKSSTTERNEGLDDMVPQRQADRVLDDGVGGDNPRNRTNTPKQNFHPTVKPIALMAYLCRLVTQPGGVVLDPFMGSGTTGIACVLEGFDFIGIEREQDYFEIAKHRIDYHKKKKDTQKSKDEQQMQLSL
jgi:site-specific DNA-methyltransferase (adenine-specific)